MRSDLGICPLSRVMRVHWRSGPACMPESPMRARETHRDSRASSPNESVMARTSGARPFLSQRECPFTEEMRRTQSRARSVDEFEALAFTRGSAARMGGIWSASLCVGGGRM